MADLLERINADIRQLVMPVIQADRTDLASRLDALLAAMPTGAGDMCDAAELAAMMRVGEGRKDSLHQLVMDLHRR